MRLVPISERLELSAAVHGPALRLRWYDSGCCLCGRPKPAVRKCRCKNIAALPETRKDGLSLKAELAGPALSTIDRAGVDGGISQISYDRASASWFATTKGRLA